MNSKKQPKGEYPSSPTDSLSLDGGEGGLLPNGSFHVSVPRIDTIPEKSLVRGSYLLPDPELQERTSLSPSQGRLNSAGRQKQSFPRVCETLSEYFISLVAGNSYVNPLPKACHSFLRATMKCRLSGSLQRLSNFKRPVPWKSFRQKVDVGYGWVIVSAAFLCSFIVDGVANSFGMYLIEFTDLYGEPESVTSWIGSLLVGTYLCMGPIACGLADSFGYRIVIISGSLIASLGFGLSFFVSHVHLLFLTFGIIGGIGFGLIYSPSVMCVCSYFKEKSALAVGIAVCGSSVGGMVFPYVAQIILENYGWQGSMLLLSAVSLNCCIAGALMKTVRAKSSKNYPASSISSVSVDNVTKSSGKCQLPPRLQQAILDITSLGVYKVPTFLLYSMASFIGSIAFLTPSFFLPDFVIKTGLMTDKEIASTIMTAVNGAGILGRVFFGWLADRPSLDALVVHNGCILTAGLSLTLIPVFTTFNGLLVDGVVYGLFIAPYISLMSIILTSRLGLDVLPSAFGQTQLLAGIASMIGPPIHGILKEVFDISIPFYFAGAAWILASLISSIIFLLPRYSIPKASPPVIVVNDNTTEESDQDALCMITQPV